MKARKSFYPVSNFLKCSFFVGAVFVAVFMSECGFHKTWDKRVKHKKQEWFVPHVLNLGVIKRTKFRRDKKGSNFGHRQH